MGVGRCSVVFATLENCCGTKVSAFFSTCSWVMSVTDCCTMVFFGGRTPTKNTWYMPAASALVRQTRGHGFVVLWCYEFYKNCCWLTNLNASRSADWETFNLWAASFNERCNTESTCSLLICCTIWCLGDASFFSFFLLALVCCMTTFCFFILQWGDVFLLVFVGSKIRTTQPKSTEWPK